MIPFLDLKAQYRSIKPEIDAAVRAVLDSGQFVLGDEVERSKHEFAAYPRRRITASPSTPARARCIWRCSPPASAPATR